MRGAGALGSALGPASLPALLLLLVPTASGVTAAVFSLLTRAGTSAVQGIQTAASMQTVATFDQIVVEQATAVGMAYAIHARSVCIKQINKPARSHNCLAQRGPYMSW